MAYEVAPRNALIFIPEIGQVNAGHRTADGFSNEVPVLSLVSELDANEVLWHTNRLGGLVLGMVPDSLWGQLVEVLDKPEFVYANRSASSRFADQELLHTLAQNCGPGLLTLNQRLAPDRSGRIGRFLGTALAWRAPQEAETAQFQMAQRMAIERARVLEVGPEAAQLVDKSHVMFHARDSNYRLTLGTPYSYIAARTLLRLGGKVRLGEGIDVKTFAKAVLADMSEEERALTLTRDWQLGAKVKNPLAGPVARIFQQVVAGMGVARSVGPADYRKVAGLQGRIAHVPEAEVLGMKIITPPDAPAEGELVAQIDRTAEAVLAVVKDDAMSVVDALDILDFIMRPEGKQALFRASRHNDQMVGLDVMHRHVKAILGASAYYDALDNRTVSGNVPTSGDTGTIRQVAGRLPTRTNVRRYGDNGRWRIMLASAYGRGQSYRR